MSPHEPCALALTGFILVFTQQVFAMSCDTCADVEQYDSTVCDNRHRCAQCAFAYVTARDSVVKAAPSEHAAISAGCETYAAAAFAACVPVSCNY